jgi:hypothetical protein
MLIGNKELKVSIKFAKNNSRVIRNQHTILEFKHKEHSENFSMKKIKKVSKIECFYLKFPVVSVMFAGESKGKKPDRQT